MTPIYHKSNNMVLGPPKGMEDSCQKLSATMLTNEGDGQVTITTFWKPSPEELALLNSNGSIALWVWGRGHPPVWLDVVP